MRTTEKNILIERKELQQQTDLRTYYMGEALKRKTDDADIIESSCDEKELFEMFLKTACNELIASAATRFPEIICEIDENFVNITFTSNKKEELHLMAILRQSVTDYLVNEITLQWLLLRNPEMAQSYISLRMNLYNKVQQQFAKLYNNNMRRRATDLAGI